MAYELSVREEVLQTSHQWPVIFSFCLAGIVIGWGVSIFWPTTYRASKEVYVGINPYRALEDRSASEQAELQFANPDDYKNWQMSNLNSIIQMDWLIQETLMNLRAEDDYWDAVSPVKLGRMLNVNWRNAGKWRLVAEDGNQQRASQAVSAWHKVVLKELKNATLQAQNALLFDIQLQEIAARRLAMEMKLSELREVQDSLMDWERKFIAPATASGHTLDESDRLQLVFLLNNASQDNKWLRQFAPVIPQGSSTAEYQQWMQQVKYAGEMEINSLISQVDFLNEQEAQIYSQYTRASNKSYGLSSNLVIEEISERSIEQYAVRPMGLIILAGGAIGLLLWTALWLIKVTL